MWLPRREHFNLWISTAQYKGYFANDNHLVINIDLSNTLYHLIAEPNTTINAMNDILPYMIDALMTMFRAIAHYKNLCKNFGIEPIFVLFADIGESQYHLELYPDYKVHRHVRPDYIIEHVPSLKKVYDVYGYNRNISNDMNNSNRDLAVCGRLVARRYILDAIRNILIFIKNVKVIILDNIETDFIPFYIDRYEMPDCGLYMTNSADNDMIQNITRNHCIIHKRYNIVTYKNIDRFIASHITKDDVVRPSIFYAYTLYKAIVGDNTDHVPGVKGYGPKRALPVIEEYISHIKRHNIDMYNKDKSSEDILSDYMDILKDNSKLELAFKKHGKDKVLSDIVLCLRLVDFDIISRTLRTLSKFKHIIDKIHDCISTNNATQYNDFISLLHDMFDVAKQQMPTIETPVDIINHDDYWKNTLKDALQ